MTKYKKPSKVERTPDRISKHAGHSRRPIDEHGDYDGTDVGFTTSSIQGSKINSNSSKNSKKGVRPINKHGNYDGTDVGFTSSSFSDQTSKD